MGRADAGGAGGAGSPAARRRQTIGPRWPGRVRDRIRLTCDPRLRVGRPPICIRGLREAAFGSDIPPRTEWLPLDRHTVLGRAPDALPGPSRIPRAAICEELEAGKVAFWIGEPNSDRPAASRERGPEDCRLTHDSPAGSGSIGQDQHAGNVGRSPPETFRRDPDRQPGLHVESSKRFLYGCQLRLHLNDQYNVPRLVPSKNVDRAALAIVRERRLDLQHP